MPTQEDWETHRLKEAEETERQFDKKKKGVSSTSNREEGVVEHLQLSGNWVAATKQESCKSVTSLNQV